MTAGPGGSPAVVTLAGGGAKAVASLLMVTSLFCSQQASSGGEAARPGGHKCQGGCAARCGAGAQGVCSNVEW